MQTFEELNLPEQLSISLNKIGFMEPTKVQSQSIPLLVDGRDLMVCAETGSGKTGAYLIPMVKRLLENEESQGMVLAPTRELAQQIFDFLRTLVPDERKFHVTRLVGGQDIRKQFKSLQRKPRIIVATPGRLIDHLKRNTVQIHGVDSLVLDEGDRMIDMGFAPQLNEIVKFLSADRQSCFFTATMDNRVKELAKKYLKNPQTLKLSEARPVSKIRQSVVQVEFKDKDQCLVEELNQREGSVIVFLKTKYRTDFLADYLAKYGFAVDLIHGGRTQGQRNRAITSFKKGKSRILCATDVAARGIDVSHVEHVINFDLPMQDEDYVHRVGRTARNGAGGEAVSFVTPQEHGDWNRLVKKYQIPDAMLEEVRGVKKGKKRTAFGRGDKKKGSFAGRGKKKSSFRDGGKKRDSFSEDGDFKDKRSASGKPSKKKASFGAKKKDKFSADGDFKDKRSASGKPKRKKSASSGRPSKKSGKFADGGKKKSFSKKASGGKRAKRK